jgi:hypothetical protein
MGTNYPRRWNRMKQLKAHGCCICGYNKCSEALEFHHINEENKLFNLSIGQMTRKPQDIIIEFHKCILLCSNCHREVHANERERGEL